MPHDPNQIPDEVSISSSVETAPTSAPVFDGHSLWILPGPDEIFQWTPSELVSMSETTIQSVMIVPCAHEDCGRFEIMTVGTEWFCSDHASTE